MHHTIATKPNDQGDTDSADEIDERKEDRVVKDCIDVRVSVVVVDRYKTLQRLTFSVKDLHRLCTGKMLLQKSINTCHARANHVVSTPRAFAKPGGGCPQHRNRQQSHQR